MFTTKHHDGFCMFDTSYTDYKITNTPYGEGIVAQVTQACKERSMPLGFYYSPPDMHHPAFRDTPKLAKEIGMASRRGQSARFILITCRYN